jgi:predicted RNase H-like nuclease (RuvC/YqgF family)
MDANSNDLNLFATRVRQMILQYKDLEAENASLRTAIGERNDRIQQLEGQLTQAHNDYESLKMAKMLEITDGDMVAAQKRMAKLIRDVDKCITLISEK